MLVLVTVHGHPQTLCHSARKSQNPLHISGFCDYAQNDKGDDSVTKGTTE